MLSIHAMIANNEALQGRRRERTKKEDINSIVVKAKIETKININKPCPSLQYYGIDNH
jgi:hypothetical protein